MRVFQTASVSFGVRPLPPKSIRRSVTLSEEIKELEAERDQLNSQLKSTDDYSLKSSLITQIGLLDKKLRAKRKSLNVL